VNALGDEKVAEYLNTHFVSAYQKVGTFRVVNGQKQGGNVASYFCTPDGQVLHAVPGPVNAATLLREARFAVETCKLAQLEKARGVSSLSTFAKAHADRLQQEHNVQANRRYMLQGRQANAGALQAVLKHYTAHAGLNQQAQVHALLSNAPLVRLEQAYQVVFERILGERISSNPVDVVGAANR
jgi:hypothetical protein